VRQAIIDHGKILVVGSPENLKSSLGGDIITLNVNEKKDISSLIEKIENVKEIKLTDGGYRIKVKDGELTAPLIIETLRDKGIKVTKLSLSKPTLNEVYLEYTGRSMRDQEESIEDFRVRRIALRRARRR